jgi:hypothetical protein
MSRKTGTPNRSLKQELRMGTLNGNSQQELGKETQNENSQNKKLEPKLVVAPLCRASVRIVLVLWFTMPFFLLCRKSQTGEAALIGE